MKKFFLIAIIIFSFPGGMAQSKDESSIRYILDRQVNAWNMGDIRTFMQGYWQSDSLLFIGKTGVTYGWQPTLDNYKKRYPDTASMGKLTFTLLEFKPLAFPYYFVVGKWHLERSIGNIEGHFSLLFKKIINQWFIVADHSS
ncbi:MAG: DUF4440 domain-containing protein [Ginsengibacter sp.]